MKRGARRRSVRRTIGVLTFLCLVALLATLIPACQAAQPTPTPTKKPAIGYEASGGAEISKVTIYWKVQEGLRPFVDVGVRNTEAVTKTYEAIITTEVETVKGSAAVGPKKEGTISLASTDTSALPSSLQIKVQARAQ